ncbi:hypothetical protein PPC_0156 [Pseudomonas protegens Cab57]|nr:hypothetical protein PPC_0156 [Pseudomonas protegens Cab57]
MKVVWVPEAVQDRMDIWDYLHVLNPRAAVDMEGASANASTIWSSTRRSAPRDWWQEPAS